MKENRIEEIDLLRGIAIILIVFGHVIKDGVVYKFLYSFHVPLFFIVSGMVFRTKNQENFKEFLKRNFKQLIVPYLIWSYIALIPFAIFGNRIGNVLNLQITSDNIISYLFGILYGNPKTGFLKAALPLWFLPCLFSIRIMMYGIYKIKNYIKINDYILLIIFFIGLLCSYYLSFNKIILPFSIETAFSMLFFFEIGILLRNKIEDIRKIKKTYMCFFSILFLIIGVIVQHINYDTVSVATGEYGNIYLAIIASATLCISFILLSFIIKSKVINKIGKNTMTILIIHKYPILIFQTLVPLTKVLLKQIDTFKFFVSACIVSAISIFISQIIGDIIKKYLPKFKFLFAIK